MELKTALDRAGATDPNRGRFCPHPLADLRVQHYGLTLAWLPEPKHARWERLAEMPGNLTAATLMPALSAGADDGIHYGRPRRAVANPERLEKTAVLVDLAGQNQWEAVRRLYEVDDPLNSKELKMVKRDLPAAREMLAHRGILPWAAWTAGRVPKTWWREPEFDRGIVEWVKAAACQPSRPPGLPASPVLDYIRL